MSTTTPKKKNAASQFRSRRARVSHPLLESPAATPPRAKQQMVAPVTPEHPTLLNALEMAARPSPVSATIKDDGKKDNGATAPQKSYASSLEAMAAHVEASHNTKRRSSKKPSSQKSTSPPKLKKRTNSSGSSSVTSSRSRKKSPGTRALQQAGRAAPFSPQNKLWLIAIPILLSFLVCEFFLWLLVFRFNEVSSSLIQSEVVVPEASIINGALLSQERDFEDSGVNIADIFLNSTSVDEDVVEGEGTDGSDEMVAEDSASSGIHDEETSHSSTQRGDSDLEEAPEETGMESSEELLRLQSMLEEGFAKLMRSGAESDEEESSRKLVESLCGNVWVVANEMLSYEPLNSDGNIESDGSGPKKLVELSQEETNSWRSLALDAHHCLGGAGLAFLTKDVDNARLRVSTKVFDRLVSVEPQDINARGGLGTSLLIQGIFRNENGETGTNEADDAQHSLLALAAYHLKVASSLFSMSHNAAVGAGSVDTDVSGMSTASISNLSTVDDETSAANAAILHNLALAYIALGDNMSSVPILLRAAALRRERHTDTKLYWNAPHEVLQMAEEKALLMAAKTKKPEKAKTKRIPFFR